MVHQCSSYTYIYIYIYQMGKSCSRPRNLVFRVKNIVGPSGSITCPSQALRHFPTHWLLRMGESLFRRSDELDITWRPDDATKVDQGWSRLMICKWCGRKTWFKQDHTGINLNLLKSVYLYVCFCVLIYLCIYIFISLYIYICICLSIYLTIYLICFK